MDEAKNQARNRGNMRTRFGNIVLCVMAAGLCMGMPAAGLLMTAANGFHVTGENRALAEFPTIHEAGDLLEFPHAFEEWFTDHLFFKNRLVAAKSWLEVNLFGELDSDKVILGNERPWLFHSSDDGQPLETYKHTNLFTDEQLAEIENNLSNLYLDLKDANIGFILMISPDKEQVYGDEYMPDWIKVQPGSGRTQQLIDYLSATLPELPVVYPRDALLRAKGTLAGVDSLYYESDTHWNRAGAYIASEELLQAIGRLTGNSYVGRTMTFLPSEPVEGDLQRMAQLGASFDSTEYEPESHRDVSVLREIRDVNDEAILLTSECADEAAMPVSVYLCGDSFRWNLSPWLEEGVARADIASRYYFDTEDLSMREPQVFVYMIAERYLKELSRLPGYNTAALPMPTESN